jgi:ATP-dependent Lon protease
LVALPAATVYLNIFEARYRVLFSTLLSGADGLEEGLVNPDSPFCGTREFGLSFVDQNGGLSAIGTLLRIEAHERLEDGQLQIESLGMERYRILSVKQERPVLVCDVQFLEREDDDEADEELQGLREKVADLSRDTLRLSYKMGKIDLAENQWDLPEFRELNPHDLSCWIAYNFMQDSFSKQAMLEINSTRQRLKREAELLQKNLSYLSAASALEGAFRDIPDQKL